jgi:hypothetical protein
MVKLEIKERIQKPARENPSSHTSLSIKNTSHLSTQTLKARKALKKNNNQPRILYPVKLPFDFDGKTKTFQDKDRLQQFISTRSALWKIFKGIFHTEENK